MHAHLYSGRLINTLDTYAYDALVFRLSNTFSKPTLNI